MTTGLEESKVAVKWVGPWLGPPKGFTIEGAIEEVVELVKVVDVVFKNTRDMPGRISAISKLSQQESVRDTYLHPQPSCHTGELPTV